MKTNFIVQKTVDALKDKKTILFPTDTVWGIGGDASQTSVIEAVYKIKRREKSKALLCLMRDLDMVAHYFDDIPTMAHKFLRADEPTTVILEHPKGLPSRLIAEDDSMAIRIPQDSFCQALLSHFKYPIIATSANISGQHTPTNFGQIEPAVLEAVDYVVPLNRTQKIMKPSRILKVSNTGEVIVIRD